MEFTIRPELPDDISLVREINRRAFGRDGEADLVDRIRANCSEILSLVAEASDQAIVGHALFSPVAIQFDGRTITGAGLGPIAVLPEFQRRGAGAALIRAGLDDLIRRQTPFVVVLGHPEYYPRFGFEPAGSRYGIQSNWDVRDEVFMIRIIQPTVMRGVR